jgi:hypothetical protein
MSGNLPGVSHAPQVQIPAIVFCVVAPVFVGIRFWSRIRASNALGADDWTILGSLVCYEKPVVFISMVNLRVNMLTLVKIFSLAVSILMLKGRFHCPQSTSPC